MGAFKLTGNLGLENIFFHSNVEMNNFTIQFNTLESYIEKIRVKHLK